MAEPLIHRRIRAALERVRWRKGEVRAIYLDEADRLALDKAASKKWGGPVHRLSFDDLPITRFDFDGHLIKPGCRSAIYLRGSGEEIAIAKKLGKV
jgi:hypothetical protein